MLRNRLWTAWLRLPLTIGLRATLRTALLAFRDPAARQALGEALAGAGWIVRERRPVSHRTSDFLATLVELPA